MERALWIEQKDPISHGERLGFCHLEGLTKWWEKRRRQPLFKSGKLI
jgi:hypothetical protein